MKLEKTLVSEICEWLKEQGHNPQTERTIGKGRRRIRTDICFEEENRLIAIETKTGNGGTIYDGIGKACTYLAYGASEAWLALPSKYAKRVASICKKIGLPIYVFDITHKKLIKSRRRGLVLQTIRYVCPICGETIHPEAKWLKLHMRTKHDCKFTIKEIEDAIMALRYDKTMKATISWYRSHADEADY